MVGARLCFGFGLERLSSDGKNLWDCAARGIAGIGALAGADFYTGDEGGGRARRKYFVRTGGFAGWKRTRVAGAGGQPGDLPSRGGVCRAARDFAGGHEV